MILRSDGNGKIGYGHLSRLNAFAEILKDNYETTFLTKEDSNLSIINPNLKVELLSKKFNMEEEVQWMSEKYNNKEYLIIADGYQFTSNYQKSIKKKGFKLIFVDDMISDYMYADCVINHAIGVDIEKYIGEEYVNYLLGPKYSLLRSSFLKLSKSIREKEIFFKTAFVSFGGTDSSILIRNAVNALLKFNNFKIINVIVGRSFNDIELRKFLENNKRIEFLMDIDEKAISEIMEKTDFAIVPSSTISYELASSRCIIASGYTTQNQFHIYEGLRKKNVIYEMGDLLKFQEKDFCFQIERVLSAPISDLKEKITNQINLFDGLQSERLIKIVNSLVKKDEVKL